MRPSVPLQSLSRAQSQTDRWPRALDPDYAKVDDRSLFSLLDFACRFGSLVNYYGLDNNVAGDWVEFFAVDPVVTLASIVATDIEGAERRLARLRRRIRSERSYDRKRARLVELFEATLDLPRQINRWLRGMSASNAAGTSLPWRTTIEAAIQQSLGERLQQLRAYDLGAKEALGSPLGLDYSDFAAAWRVDRVDPNTSIYLGTSGAERIEHAVPHLLSAWRPFPLVVARWAADARPQLAAAFERGGSHQPHIALFVAFAKLFATAQASINSFAGRRTDFYFRRVLRERNRLAVPDIAYVAFTCANGKEPLAVAVPAQTLLSAGKGADGRDIVFESQGDISVTSAVLAQVITIRVVSGPLIVSDTSHTVTERVVGHVVTPEPAVPEGWATFGSVDDEAAEMGFAVSSPSLDLAGGERSIALELGCAPVTVRASELLAGLATATGVAQGDVFDRLLEQAFVVSVSTAAGWLPVGPYAVERFAGQDPWQFTLSFALGEDASAVSSLPGSGVASTVPTVRADLRQERVTVSGPSGKVSVYPLSVLEGLTVATVQVHIDVAGLPGVRVANMAGDVDQSKPFPIFGAVPAVGSYMRIRHTELFSKTVSRLALNIKWFDLPKNHTGFRGYYRGYVVDSNGVRRVSLFDNQVFRASVTVERPGSWTIATPSREGDYYLFRTDGHPGNKPDADDVLAKSTSFEDLVVQPVPGPPAGYEPWDGCVRVELSAPAYAFGHGIYQPNMMNAVLSEVPTESTCEATCRDEYSVLADAGRRLAELQKEVERTRWLARVLQWLSPLYWLAKLAQGLRAVYLWLTRSVPAYVERRPDPASRSGSVIRIRYADGDFRHRSAAPLLVGRSYKHTVTSRLDLTLRSLLDAAHTCLSECLTEWQDRFPGEEWHRLQRQLAEAGAARIPDRLAALRALHSRLDEAANSGGAAADPAQPLLARCQALLLAASWVRDCEAGCEGSPRTGRPSAQTLRSAPVRSRRCTTPS
jgi:hypothetical protein